MVFPKYEQNHWAAAAGYAEFDWPTLVELWSSYNRLVAQVMRRVPDDQRATPCMIGPYETQTLEFLIVDYVDHQRHHLTKIDERLTEIAS
ncbi:MAG: hypothetical protein QM811_25000 [Pirellulales bacterium]